MKPASELTRDDLLNLLRSFIAKRPGLDPRDYGDWRDYRKEATEVSRDYRDAMTLLDAVSWRAGITADHIREALQGSSRLTLSDDGRLSYCAGQYFPTEYRPAAARVLAGLLWRYWAVHRYNADDIRKEAAAHFGAHSRIVRFYFN